MLVQSGIPLSSNALSRMDILTLNDLSSFDFESLDTDQTIKSSVPTVAILGHFNHGKTTLLDAFCNTDIVSTELHGITQVSPLLFIISGGCYIGPT